MSKKIKTICFLLAVLLVVATVAAVLFMKSRYSIVSDMSSVKNSAVRLYQEGDIEGAIIKMQAYCAHVTTDSEARIMLGDWHVEIGQEDEAYSYYYEAAYNKTPAGGIIAPLTVKNSSEILLEPINEIMFEITPDVRRTKDMTLVITSSNIVPHTRMEGRILEGEEALEVDENFYTTDWFKVDPTGEYLTMSGGFNCAIWQFRSKSGLIENWVESVNTYRRKDTYSVDVYQMARVHIPKDAVECRVTYYDKTKAEVTAFPEEPLTIVYGRLPSESRPADTSYYKIPDLEEGESIVFENSEWRMITKQGETILKDWKVPMIEKGSYFAVGGTLPGKVSFDKSKQASYEKSGIYTIRFDAENPTAAGFRMDDAKNLGFNAAVAEGTIALGKNHFDNIYPWNEIKLCNIKDGEVVAYEGEIGFSQEGVNGDVFVEIPKFYVRRIVDTRYDTISISGVKHEGFFVDDAFKTANGEADKIYIAAYLTAENEQGEAVSCANSHPQLMRTPKELAQNAQAKGYSEIDYAAISAVQKLFMVETGLRNSQYLFMGVCAYTMPGEKTENAPYGIALNSATKSNRIDIASKTSFYEGNTVILFDSTRYAETSEAAIQDQREITAVIKNADGTSSIYFSGEPTNIYAGATAISHIAMKNGTARSVKGHTGAVSTDRGTVSFKYRNIENLWGNIYVYVDKVRVKNGKVTLTDRAGNQAVLSYSLPDAADVDAVDSMVRRVGYDDNFPGILLPCEIGSGATISTFYGDTYQSDGKENTEYVLHYGGAWNSRACAGLFAFVTNATEDEAYINAGGRMMYIK